VCWQQFAQFRKSPAYILLPVAFPTKIYIQKLSQKHLMHLQSFCASNAVFWQFFVTCCLMAANVVVVVHSLPRGSSGDGRSRHIGAGVPTEQNRF
jgi:hypothetical protein